MRAKALGYNLPTIVEAWQHDSTPIAPSILDQLAQCHKMSAWTVNELASLLKDKEESQERRLLASLLLLGRGDTSPLEVLYAQVTLISVAKSYELFWNVAGHSFDRLVRKDWRRFIGNRFLLRHPALYIPPISDACDSKIQGWGAAANIILAASPTVNLTFPDGLRRQIKDLAGAE
jgi:hypothetical protein